MPLYSISQLADCPFTPARFAGVADWEEKLGKVYPPHDDSYQLLLSAVVDASTMEQPSVVLEAGLSD